MKLKQVTENKTCEIIWFIRGFEPWIPFRKKQPEILLIWILLSTFNKYYSHHVGLGDSWHDSCIQNTYNICFTKIMFCAISALENGCCDLEQRELAVNVRGTSGFITGKKWQVKSFVEFLFCLCCLLRKKFW